MIKKNLLGALMFSIGLGCYVDSAFATAPISGGVLDSINEACQFNNLGGTTNNLCGGTGWVGIECTLPTSPTGSTVVITNTLIYLESTLCVVNSANFAVDDVAGTITYCLPAAQIVGCLTPGSAPTKFAVTRRLGGELSAIGNAFIYPGV